MSPARFRELLDHGVGLDDVYANPAALSRRIEENRPHAVCFNSKGALERFAGSVAGQWDGAAAALLAQFEDVRIVWAVPDSSGRAASYRPERSALLRELRSRIIKGLREA